MTNQIYIANLGKYVEGELVGGWFEFPVDMSEVAEEIGLNERYEEIAIHDYETVYPISIGEYDNIKSLNEKIEMLDNVDGLKELCEALTDSSEKYNVNGWGELLRSVLCDLGCDHDIVDDEYIEHHIANNASDWTRLKFFLADANINNDYHLLDGYGNIAELWYDDAWSVLKDAVNNFVN